MPDLPGGGGRFLRRGALRQVVYREHKMLVSATKVSLPSLAN
ncbi:hypothetical protein EKH55_1433 [Sinorhizobium alkalisoli]|nr:hypothetical protein EKH55_1433 [Sinorhizobium alkalisoli]